MSLTLTEAPGGPPKHVRQDLRNLNSGYIRQLVIDCMHELEERSVAYQEANAILSKKGYRDDREAKAIQSKREDRDHR